MPVISEEFFTFEDAFERYQDLSELYGHVSPIHLYYFKGRITITYQKPNKYD